jgi:GTP-binding protein HflX
MNDKMIDQNTKKTRTYVIHIDVGHLKSPSSRHDYDEAVSLAKAMDVECVGHYAVHVRQVHAATLLRSGAVDELKDKITSLEVELLVANTHLSPTQQRNLERALNVKVIDRTGLILEIFGLRAQTKEGRLQVDLAALSYQRSRLVRSWTHLERQRGGLGFMGGPGERQIELDRRMLDEKIIKIKRDLEKVKQTRSIQRGARIKTPIPTVALVGYTNAGKSTLFNALTGSDVFSKDLLFATLDPTMRKLQLPSNDSVILSDTVGFISNLPTDLIAAFRATLEEVCRAQCILHVHDLSHEAFDNHHQCVTQTLINLGISEEDQAERVIHVFNKIDDVDLDMLTHFKKNYPHACFISATKKQGLEQLMERIQQFFYHEKTLVHIHIPHEEGQLLAWCYRKGHILTRHDGEEGINLSLKLKVEYLDKISNYLLKI